MKKHSVSNPEEQASGPDRLQAPQAPKGDNSCSFPIVAIGASAGGLEALNGFFSHVPADSGMAYVVIQHLDPSHKAILSELLQSHTPLKVLPAAEGVVVCRNRIYVIPANKVLSIAGGKLRLLEPTSPRGRRLPIDFFFRALAADRAGLSVGVILSGMGSDGALGLKAIKEASGLVLVQEPDTAQFSDMPRSAISTGLVDLVAPVEELPERIQTSMQHAAPPMADAPTEGLSQTGMDRIILLLRTHTGHDFSLYKTSTLHRRVERRMGIHQVDQVDNYIRCLEQDPQEIELLFRELLIGVTNFFRDPAVWEHLRDVELPALLAKRAQFQEFRAWVPGCSSGEEAYSLAITFLEAVESITPARHCRLQIFATDLDPDAIDRARQGRFAENIAADVSPERLERFFLKKDGHYQIKKTIRESIIFAPQNVIMDPPFTRIDIVVCRNLLIYLKNELQKKLLSLFYYSLRPDGLLFLGSSESLGGHANLFASTQSKMRIYRRLEVSPHAVAVEFPPALTPTAPGTAPSSAVPPKPPSLSALADQVILEHHVSPSVLATPAGDVVYIRGRTGRYLEPAAGKANLNIFAMTREGLRGELSVAFQKALRQEGPVDIKGVCVESEGPSRLVDVTVQCLQTPPPLCGMVLIVFKESLTPPAPPPPGEPSGDRADESQELDLVRQELLTTREEMQTSQEELRSTNQEFQSTNEELQSTNEELTTSREEMQSMNEELRTVNAELQAKLEELSRASSDMRNLLESTDIATLFLDNELRVRRYTEQAARIIRLIPSDVGRPVTDLVSDLDYAALADDTAGVLRTSAVSEKEIPTGDGRWYRVRIMPYRTPENQVDGVVITLADISAYHRTAKGSQ